ncbi:unnamed protein product [Acidocella sp. C78]|nr:unnamed protein product [Acidocella sp. C78]CAG4919082.1 unnamed protein product [Acidocella sp. C78]
MVRSGRVYFCPELLVMGIEKFLLSGGFGEQKSGRIILGV